jgi:hypothetical protein
VKVQVIRCFSRLQHSSGLSGQLLPWHKIDISTLATVSHTTEQTLAAVWPAVWLAGGRGEDFLVPKFMESIE